MFIPSDVSFIVKSNMKLQTKISWLLFMAHGACKVLCQTVTLPTITSDPN